MRHVWIVITALGFSLLAGAEVQHSGGAAGKGRTESASASRKLSDAINACSNGRSPGSSRGLAVQPVQPISQPSIYRSTPVEPPKAKGPFARENPRENKEFPGETKFQQCLDGLPVVDYFTCPAVLTTCRAETVDGGKTKIRPLSVDGGDPCSAGNDFSTSACGRGLTFERFKTGDIVCGPTQADAN